MEEIGVGSDFGSGGGFDLTGLKVKFAPNGTLYAEFDELAGKNLKLKAGDATVEIALAQHSTIQPGLTDIYNSLYQNDSPPYSEEEKKELARVRWARARPRAAMTVDRYGDDWSALAWVQALGTVRVLDVEDAPAELAALVARYSQYRDQTPRGPVLVLVPDRLLWWRAAGA